MKKDFEDLAEEAIQNIRKDREQTHELLQDLIKYIAGAEDRHRDVGLTAAKYVETLQRSNEQIVKIATLMSKNEKADGLSENDMEDIYSMIKKEDD